jgi:hypothetical protein
MKQRPFPVTILAILAGVAAVLAAVHCLQAFGILPYFLGDYKVRGFNLWSGLMWALMVYIWVWLVQMLWRVDPQAWMFLAAIAALELIFNTFYLIFGGVTASFSDVSLSFIVSGLILIYVLLPSTKAAFGIPNK